MAQRVLFLSFLFSYRLFKCRITGKGCAALVSALMSNPSHLKELNLAGNDLTESQLNVLFALVHDPLCALEKLEYVQLYLKRKSNMFW